MHTTSSFDPSHPVVENTTFRLGIDRDGILNLIFEPDVHIAVSDMKFVEKKLQEVSGNKPFKLIMDTRNRYIQFDREARRYAATSPITKNILGQAVLMNNLPTRLLFNFYTSIDKPQYPIKAFKTREPAVEWLKAR